MPLNFGGQKRSGAFDMVWPPANIWNQGKKWQSLEQCTEHMILKRMTQTEATRTNRQWQFKTKTEENGIQWNAPQKPPEHTESGISRQKSRLYYNKAEAEAGSASASASASASSSSSSSSPSPSPSPFPPPFSPSLLPSPSLLASGSWQHPKVFPGGPPPQY